MSIKEKLVKGIARLSALGNDLEGFEENLTVAGKTIKEANVEQASWLAYYDIRKMELEDIRHLADVYVDEVYGKLYRRLTEKQTRALSEGGKKAYIESDDAFIEAKDMFYTVNALYRKYVSVVDAFSARGFALKNIVESYINSVYSEII